MVHGTHGGPAPYAKWFIPPRWAWQHGLKPSLCGLPLDSISRLLTLFDLSDTSCWPRWPGLRYCWWECYQSRLRVWRGLTEDGQNFRPPGWCKNVMCPACAWLSCVPHHSGSNVVERIRWIVWYGYGFVDCIALTIIVLPHLCLSLCIYSWSYSPRITIESHPHFFLFCILSSTSSLCAPCIASESSRHVISRFIIAATRSFRSPYLISSLPWWTTFLSYTRTFPSTALFICHITATELHHIYISLSIAPNVTKKIPISLAVCQWDSTDMPDPSMPEA